MVGCVSKHINNLRYLLYST
ncbi:unnamed protein product [Linum tenue]|uniref:Uncharacterized protein n=1 Tax=Linum tenue TaxID=586396 RepID=A0AAV0NGW1_9ROSI|nr:unnamed protein product [Linum tenue]CAI0457709.1 unnamed protein product [Linum tenue]